MNKYDLLINKVYMEAINLISLGYLYTKEPSVFLSSQIIFSLIIEILFLRYQKIYFIMILMYISSIFSLIEQKEQHTHTMLNKHNERRVYISAELDVTEKKTKDFTKTNK